MALYTELAAKVLTGSGLFGDEPAGQPIHKRSGALILALDAGLFRPLADVAADAGQLLRAIEQSPPAAGFRQVHTPGKPEREARASRLIEGIPLADATWQEIVDVARSVGISDSDVASTAAPPVTTGHLAPWWETIRSAGDGKPASRPPAEANQESRS